MPLYRIIGEQKITQRVLVVVEADIISRTTEAVYRSVIILIWI